MDKQDIKEIVIALLIAGIAIGTSMWLDNTFYLRDAYSVVEKSRDEKAVSYSFCYTTIDNELDIVLRCDGDTPEYLMKLHGYEITRRV
jgi:hypothetical protein